MNPASILQAITAAMSVANSLVEVGRDVAPLVQAVYGVLAKGENVTREDLDTLRRQSDAWGAEISAPLPPEEE